MEISGALVQRIERGNGICNPSSSLSCSILGNICTSKVLEKPGDQDLPTVKCKEESRRAGSFQSAFGSFSDKQVNNKVDSVTDELKYEKLVRKKKKKRKNKKKSYSTKEISNKIVYETGQSKNDVSNAKEFVESSRRADQYVSQSSEVATCESVNCEEQKLKTNQSSMPHNDCRSKKGQKYHGENFLRLHNKFCLCGREFLEVPFKQNYYKNSDMAQRTYSRQHVFTNCAPDLRSSSASAAHGQLTTECSTKFSVPLQCGFQPYNGMKMPAMSHVLTRSFQASANCQSYMRVKQSNQHCHGEDITSGINAKKWVAVGTRGARSPEKTASASICHFSDGDFPSFCARVNDSLSGGNIGDHYASAELSKSKDTKLNGGHRINISETEIPHPESQSTTTKVQYIESSEVAMEYVQKLKDIQHLIIGLQMVKDPLNAAYKMQLVSEGFELVMGCPLAEFERFLHSAAPVITSSYLHEKCAACLGDQPSNISFCKHQIANTSLSTVWKWYEEPGNYGLKVKAGDSQNLKGLLAESTSFHAHFVPFLSAVQLFGYSRPSNTCGTSDEHANPDMHVRNSSTGKHFLAKDSIVKFDSVEEPVNSYKLFCSGDHSQSFIPSLLCSSNCELVFEFFETEIPPLRKPLYNKIVDLIDDEDSNLHVFGDPSKLKSLKLQHLHPASWFSVAWYPTYRIPEGKFTAAFLTYHSFGHLVQREMPFDSVYKETGCVVSPVVGLQSYSTKGECWFDLKRPLKSSLKESSPFNCSEILREQLKTLTENASLFAEGCVWKDGIKVFNRHQDYEFFRSRN